MIKNQQKMTIIKPLGEQSLSGFYFVPFNYFLLVVS